MNQFIKHPLFLQWSQDFSTLKMVYKPYKPSQNDLVGCLYHDLFKWKADLARRWGCIMWLSWPQNQNIQIIGAVAGSFATFCNAPFVYIYYVHTFPCHLNHTLFLLHFEMGQGTFMMTWLFHQLKKYHNECALPNAMDNLTQRQKHQVAQTYGMPQQQHHDDDDDDDDKKYINTNTNNNTNADVDIEMRINTNQEEQKDHTFHIPLRIRLQNNGGTKAFICYSKAAYFNHASIWISPYAALPEGSKKRTDYEFDPLLWISERVQQNNPQYKIQNKHKKPKFIEPCVPHWVKFLQDHPEIEPYNMFFEFL
jgi:hypothetical protein